MGSKAKKVIFLFLPIGFSRPQACRPRGQPGPETAGFDSNPILYGGQEVYTRTADSGRDYNSYAMAYPFDAYGTSYSASFPGTMLQIESGDTLKLHLTNDLAGDNDPSDLVRARGEQAAG